MSSDSDVSVGTATSEPEKKEERKPSKHKKTTKKERVYVVEDDPTEVCKVGVRMPPFWPQKPKIWFAQIEGQFLASNISNDATKFYYVLNHLDRENAVEVEDIITDPPASGKYEKLKMELIKRLSVSEEAKTKQFLEREQLGDRKPSQFLRHLRSLRSDLTDGFIRTVWTSRLPPNLQTKKNIFMKLV